MPMRYVIISEINGEAIALCGLTYRGEYECFNHRFDNSRYCSRDITEAEFSTLSEGFKVLPTVGIEKFCRRGG